MIRAKAHVFGKIDVLNTTAGRKCRIGYFWAVLYISKKFWDLRSGFDGNECFRFIFFQFSKISQSCPKFRIPPELSPKFRNPPELSPSSGQRSETFLHFACSFWHFQKYSETFPKLFGNSPKLSETFRNSPKLSETSALRNSISTRNHEINSNPSIWFHFYLFQQESHWQQWFGPFWYKWHHFIRFVFGF